VPDLLKTVIFRITQEAMTNIAKHARASLISLSLNGEGQKIELAIADNGTGFNVEETLTKERSRRGLGLESMRERTELSGGSFAIESAEGEGTTVRASWPL
jgi:signal transduction histidine kinase